MPNNLFSIAKTVHEVSVTVRFRNPPRVRLAPDLWMTPVDAVFRYVDGRLEPAHCVTLRGRLQLGNGAPFHGRLGTPTLRSKLVAFQDEPWLLEVVRSLDNSYAIGQGGRPVLSV